jgi:S-adenosylmethionine decarboxylase
VQLFGPHLIIDGTRCDTHKLGDRMLIEQILADYPAAIGMTKIGGPYMFEYQAPDPAYSGVSGIVVIAESHIAIHTFPALDYFTMDIFSCKNFDHERAIRYIKDALDVNEMDRMLVQRGLSFRGPHHGAAGATDELIAAAQARLDAGVISNETAQPEELPAWRARIAAQRGEGAAVGEVSEDSTGRMLWPQYGVTPDLGTYGAAAREPDAAGGVSAGTRILALDGTQHAPLDRLGEPLLATEPVQVNPTASISGLLDKMGDLGSGGRALSRAVAEWERLARDPDCALWLALSTPVIGEGLRELLVYLVEHRFVDGILLTGEDVFADVYEALGYRHYEGDAGTTRPDADRHETMTFLARAASELAANQGREAMSGTAFLRALGEMLPTRVPRKGLLQAAAAVGIHVYAPDLLGSQVGAALQAARAQGGCPTLDPLTDADALTSDLHSLPRFGMVAVGAGLCQRQLLLASEADGQSAQLAGSVRVGDGTERRGDGVVTVDAAPGLVLPLLVTALAQRIPSTRGLRARARKDRVSLEEQRLLA